jgi:electron transfer flavoprotein beta subunit
VPLKIVVTTKLVVDTNVPSASLKVDREAKKVDPSSNIPLIINGFDENAVEAALRIKDSVEAEITVISMGKSFPMDVVRKPLSMGADELILLKDDSFDNFIDSSVTARVLAAAIKKIGDIDLVLCGRQASDWDNAQVPLGVAEILGMANITVAQNVEVHESKVVVQRVISNGYEVVEAELPALVTVSNELGEPRYPTLRGIMAAVKKQPVVWTAEDLGMDSSHLTSMVELVDLFQPTREKNCEMIQGEDDDDAGRKLALRLREARLI